MAQEAAFKLLSFCIFSRKIEDNNYPIRFLSVGQVYICRTGISRYTCLRQERALRGIN